MMKITTEFSDELIEKIIRDIMNNYPEAGYGNSLVCVAFRYASMEFTFIDAEEDKEYKLDKAKLLAGFPLMFTDKWPKGCTPVPRSSNDEEWENWSCQADVTDFDAFIQLVCLGEVIYG